MPTTHRKRIFAAVYHSLIDTSSGAAISLRDTLEALAGRGWEVRVLSGPLLDFEDKKTNEQLLEEQGIPFKTFHASLWGRAISPLSVSVSRNRLWNMDPERPSGFAERNGGPGLAG